MSENTDRTADLEAAVRRFRKAARAMEQSLNACDTEMWHHTQCEREMLSNAISESRRLVPEPGPD